MAGDSTLVKSSYNNLVIAFKKDTTASVEVLTLWQVVFKRAMDICFSLAGLVLLAPLLLFIAIRVKLDSSGPLFYFQERIGLNGHAFTIFKFRSMDKDAEIDGPTLSHANDCRVTKWGYIMRKWKLDELPQLLNVLKGDMSLVGPRPERQFYVDQAAELYPFFQYIHQVKPGLTSMGMIKFGYAQNINQIIDRMKFDIDYLENYSLFLDFQILLYTLPSIIDSRMFTASLKVRSRHPRIKMHTLS